MEVGSWREGVGADVSRMRFGIYGRTLAQKR